MSNSGKEIFRPYARLITILGDQLITNKIVAVNEIVKNSYDADSELVTVRFFNMDNFNVPLGKRTGEDPYIEIEDDGDGMNIDIIRKVWLRPATPNKISKKRGKGEQKFTKKGRIMQGEKGIGRFAVHKLGDVINIFTKEENEDEAELLIDFKQYEQEGQLDLFDENKSDYKFLDEITNDWSVNTEPKVIKKRKGTLIRISHLRESWTDRELGRLEKSFQNLITPIIPDEDSKRLGTVNLVKDFNVEIEVDNEPFSNQDTKITFEKIAKIAPFKFIGHVSKTGDLKYEYNGTIARERKNSREFNLLDNQFDITLRSIKDRFFEIQDNEEIKTHSPKCGEFSLVLYGYDFYDKAKWKTKKDESDFIRKHNVFLYRDGVRVYPYGDPGIDWVELGKRRSEEKAGWYF
ncbi:MAG: ATP-binding protein, partial [Bacteroidota bacterium]